ncbi:MAG: hypothetical protein JWN81_876 [Solirubrobacterales bacterium]|jgi:hypothetical protein|nr:hypothetical protein [Solirubrobacterales bacterium]
MKRMTVAGLGLLAMLAASSAIAASASAALPEFSAPFSKTFTSTSKTSVLETVGGIAVTCTAATNSGEITGPQTGSVTIVFTGCKLGKVPCNTPGAAAGVIATATLSMKVGYINKAKKEVGIDLVEAAGAPFLSYGCGPVLRGVVIGSVIGRITPINKLVTPPEKFILKFAQTIGVQKTIKLEGAPIDVLETSFGGPFEQTGLASTDLILFGEPVKLIA